MIKNKKTNPKHPIYIISKNRSSTMYTSRSLAKMKVYHYIAIEPQDLEAYTKSLETFNINPYATLLVLPFSNHGKGSGPARNWCWDHAIQNSHEYHWILDDNIQDFYRMHNNKRIRVKSGVIFRVAEDFVERFENVPVSGFQYRFFCAPDQSYPAFVKNTRIFSCILIRNDCKHRWRGRYNEDVDLSLRVLKDGDCTIQFNAFLQGKCATQTVKGGNTQEIYNADEKMDKSKNADGTAEKSKMLVAQHPDVCRLAWKYNRWHHHCDFSSFKNNKLIYKKDFDISKLKKVDNYGMKLVRVEDDKKD